MLALQIKLLILSESSNLVTIFYLLRSSHSLNFSTFVLTYMCTVYISIGTLKYILFISASVKAIPLRTYSIH